jgi:hypothetical protein
MTILDRQKNDEKTIYGYMAKGDHELPKVLPGPATPDQSTPCELVTPETASWLFQGWPAHRVGVLQLSATPFGHPTPYAYDKRRENKRKKTLIEKWK